MKELYRFLGWRDYRGNWNKHEVKSDLKMFGVTIVIVVVVGYWVVAV